MHPPRRQRKRNQQLSAACEDATQATCQVPVSSNHFFIAQPLSDLFFVSRVLKKKTLLWKSSRVGRGARALFQSGARRQTRRTAALSDVFRSYAALRFSRRHIVRCIYYSFNFIIQPKIK